MSVGKMFASPRVFPVRSRLQSIIRYKVTEEHVIKRLQTENKSLFGELVETKKQKVAREKREKKMRNLTSKKAAPVPPPNESQTNSELYWIAELQRKKLYAMKFRMGKILPYHTKTILRIKKPEMAIDDRDKPAETCVAESPVKEVPLVSNVENSAPKISSSINQNCASEAIDTQHSSLLTGILVNKITSFSYLDSTKKVEPSIEKRSIVSISAYSDRSKLSIPSVTKILNKTMSEASRLNLELWKQRMILQLGEEGFQKYSQELLLNGKQFHSSIQNYLTQEPFEVPSAVEKSWLSVQHVLKHVDSVAAIESHVVHQKLGYRGIVDCVASYRGSLCVIDWKKSDKPKNAIENTFDAPIQVASYIGALNSDSNYNFQIRNGLVVVGYTNGDPATVHEINPVLVNKYWKLWLLRLQQYYVELKKPTPDSVAASIQ